MLIVLASLLRIVPTIAWILEVGLLAAPLTAQAVSPATSESAQQPQNHARQLSSAEVSHLRTKAESGSADAQRLLGLAYRDGNGVADSDVLAAEWLRKAADQGDPIAQNNLAIMYREGEGVTQDKEEAVRWYRKAAKLGNAQAMFNLGTSYYNGDGIGVDDKLAATWFFLAQQAGEAKAAAAVQRLIGKIPVREMDLTMSAAQKYEKGDEVPKDLLKALSLYREAADQGNAEAGVKAAGLLVNATSPTPEYGEAMRRCKSAATRSYSPGSLCVGMLYQHGLGVAMNTQEAAKWFLRSAELGNGQAMLYLGEAYWNGDGVEANKTTAYMWMLLASTYALPQAHIEEEQMRKEISETEIKKAKEQALEWSNRHGLSVIRRRGPEIP